MTFFLLKWIFNAIKKDAPEDDSKLQGKSYVQKLELSKQLIKNEELMRTLGYNSDREVIEGVRAANSHKEGVFTWEEFLDFFFLKNVPRYERLNDSDNWWRQVDKPEEKVGTILT